VIDQDNCILYEVYAAYPQTDGSWTGGSGAIFDLKTNGLRPLTWTSADAAGLPIFPGLARYDEVAAGAIHHALRFTAPQTQKAFVWPARHYASNIVDTNYPPMGQRFRLKASFNISTFTPNVQVLLKAMQKYGIILADNGSAWYISGAPDPRWDNNELGQFRQLQGNDFEAVDESSLMVNPNSAAVSTTGFVGNVDTGSCSTFSGWAADHNRPNLPILVSLYSDGVLAATSIADQSRPDVGTMLGDNGFHGFTIRIPNSLKDGRTHTVQVEFADNGSPISSTAPISCSGGAPIRPAKAAVWQNAYWVIDENNNQQYDGPPADRFLQWGIPGVIPVMGDWNGDGATKVGLYYQGFWYLDYNGDGVFEAGIDKVYYFGNASAIPIVGDWNGDGTTKIGIYAGGVFYLDMNGDGIFESGTDRVIGWGPPTAAQPIIGDWDGSGTSKVGVFAAGAWMLDVNGDGIYTPQVDRVFVWGARNGVPIVGDWNGDGRTKVGLFANAQYSGAPSVGQFMLDINGDFQYEESLDQIIPWGSTGSIPVVGDWNGDGRTKIGVFANGFWTLDYDGDFAWTPQTVPLENTFQFGGCGAQAYPCGQVPVPGRW
jgi:hypothetical protein